MVVAASLIWTGVFIASGFKAYAVGLEREKAGQGVNKRHVAMAVAFSMGVPLLFILRGF